MEQQPKQERTVEDKRQLYRDLMERALAGDELDMSTISPEDVGLEGRQALAAVVRNRGRRNGGDLYL